MIVYAYSIYDSKALTYSPPFFTVSHGAAVRMVMDLANDANTSVGRHPADYSLFCVGQFNDGLGLMLPAENRELITDCLPLVRRPVPLPFDANGHAATLNSDGSTS